MLGAFPLCVRMLRATAGLSQAKAQEHADRKLAVLVPFGRLILIQWMLHRFAPLLV